MKTSIETKLILNLQLDLRDAKRLFEELNEVLKEKDGLLPRMQMLRNSLDSSLDERQLF